MDLLILTPCTVHLFYLPKQCSNGSLDEDVMIIEPSEDPNITSKNNSTPKPEEDVHDNEKTNNKTSDKLIANVQPDKEPKEEEQEEETADFSAEWKDRCGF